MTCLEITENMPPDEIKKAEQCIECAKGMIERISFIQDSWEKKGVDYSQLKDEYKEVIDSIGVDQWLIKQRQILEKIRIKHEEDKIKLNKAKEKLKKKQA